MKPVFQTKFGVPEGNCFAACLASVFEIELDEVPDFGIADDWYIKFSDWMKVRFDIRPLELHIPAMSRQNWKPNGYHLISGVGSRGIYHSVVGLDGVAVHDPFPGGIDLRTMETYTIFIASIRYGSPQR